MITVWLDRLRNRLVWSWCQIVLHWINCFFLVRMIINYYLDSCLRCWRSCIGILIDSLGSWSWCIDHDLFRRLALDFYGGTQQINAIIFWVDIFSSCLLIKGRFRGFCRDNINLDNLIAMELGYRLQWCYRTLLLRWWVYFIYHRIINGNFQL